MGRRTAAELRSMGLVGDGCTHFLEESGQYTQLWIIAEGSCSPPSPASISPPPLSNATMKLEVDRSPACYAVVKKANVTCVCKLVSKEIEDLIDMEKVGFVAPSCDKKVAPGTKCGTEAVWEAVAAGLEAQVTKMMVEIDCKQLVAMLHGNMKTDTTIGGIIHDIKLLASHVGQVSFAFLNRRCNATAHLVATHVSHMGGV
ncbi:hypothetical protein ACE6H2_015399 [Prunus campanulata]